MKKVMILVVISMALFTECTKSKQDNAPVATQLNYLAPGDTVIRIPVKENVPANVEIWLSPQIQDTTVITIFGKWPGFIIKQRYVKGANSDYKFSLYANEVHDTAFIFFPVKYGYRYYKYLVTY